MKKNVLALSIAAMIGGLGFASMASAGVIVGSGGAGNMTKPNITGFTLAQGGVGHALIVPYYTAQDGNMTVLHLVNTDAENGKVVKVRFRGASNSDDVLDFQLLMSPGDVWTGYVLRGEDGTATLGTNDNTCSIPSFAAAGGSASFKTLRLNSALTADQQANETREGYVEIFNSADIPKAAAPSLYATTKHNASGVAACDSTLINAALFDTDFEQADEAAAVTAGLNAPTGGLMGDWYILNMDQTTTFSGSATALVGTAPALPAVGNFVAFPQNSSITYAAADAADLTTDPLLAGGGATKTWDGTLGGVIAPPVTANAQDFPDLSTGYYGGAAAAATAKAQAESLTQALAVSSITNQYAKDADINAKTDWVFSMPTRRYSVAMNYATSPVSRLFAAVDGAADHSQFFYTDNTKVTNGQICVGTQGAVFRGREEESKSGVPTFSPSASSSPSMCGETSVLSFGEGVAAPSVLGASVAREDASAGSIFTHGWGVLTTTNKPAAGAAVGLPILGYSVQKLTNSFSGSGFAANFGVTWPHRFVLVNP